MSISLTVQLKGSQALIDRIAAMQARLQPDNPSTKIALQKAALLLVAQAKLNLRAKGMIDTGRLINSIKWEFYRPVNLSPDGDGIGMRVGSFGVPYAAINEFGGVFRPDMRRAMFASLRSRGRLNKDYASKGVIVGGRYRSRPYMRSSYETHRERIQELIFEALQG